MELCGFFIWDFNYQITDLRLYILFFKYINQVDDLNNNSTIRGNEA